MNFSGLIVGLFTFCAIGLGFLWVVKLEYFVGARVWKAVAGLGVLVSVLSGGIADPVISAGIGILGGTILWGAFELPDQAVRVEKGMFPRNPKKRGKGGDV